MKVWYLLTALILVPLITSAVTGCSTPAAIPEPPDIADGWIRINIKDVGSIDYPTDFLEIQSEEYRDIAKETSQVLGLGKSDFTLQQVGLNELQPSAFDEYRRIIFTTEYLNPGEEVLRPNERYSLSQRELAEFHSEWIDQLRQGYTTQKNIGLGNNKIVDSGSIEIVEVNGMFPLLLTYKRQLDDNPVILVQTYIFQNCDMIHYLLFSYRVEDEEECRDIYDKILDSFRLQ